MLENNVKSVVSLNFTDFSKSTKKSQLKVTNGYAAETSGGLLLAMPAEKVCMFRDELKQLDGHDSWVVGRVVKGTRNARLSDDLKLVEVAADERDRLITV